MFRARGVYSTALIIFTFGSLICALASNSGEFILGRVVAGIGSSGALSGNTVIIAFSLPLHRRPMAQGALAAWAAVNPPYDDFANERLLVLWGQ